MQRFVGRRVLEGVLCGSGAALAFQDFIGESFPHQGALAVDGRVGIKRVGCPAEARLQRGRRHGIFRGKLDLHAAAILDF